MILIYSCIISYYIISVTFLFFCYKKYYISPIGIFSFFQLIMFTGIIRIADLKNFSDIKLIYIYLIGLAGVILGNFLKIKRLYIFLKSKSLKKLPKNINLRIILMILFSFIIIFLFFYNIGYKDIDLKNFSEYRKKINYTVGSGYIYQFRVFIFPFLILYSINFSKGITKILSYLLFPFMCIFLIASGQRMGLVIAFLSYVLALILLHHHKIKNITKNKKSILLIIIVCTLFFILTILNNRINISGSFLNAIFDRIFYDNQLAAKLAFRYIDKRPVQFGKDWFYMFLDILPGKNNYISVANLIHGYLYGGSLTGTCPPDLWGSIYYNFGMCGIFLFSTLIGFFYKIAYLNYYYSAKTPYTVFFYSYLFFYLGFWVADSPMYFFNDGVITMLILNFYLTYRIRGGK